MSCATKRLASIHKNVWSGADNRFRLRLDKVAWDLTSSPADLTSVISMTLEIEGHAITVNNGEIGGAINWWDNPASGEVEFKLGAWVEQDAIAPGSYVAQLTVVDPINPNGVVWTSFANGELTLIVHET